MYTITFPSAGHWNQIADMLETNCRDKLPEMLEKDGINRLSVQQSYRFLRFLECDALNCVTRASWIN